MPINRMIIKNYKSLKNFQLELKPLSVFIGPNNAGKSNIFDCLRFLSDFVRKSQEGQKAVQDRGGFEQIVFDGDISQIITIEIQGSMKIKEKMQRYKYHVELSGDRWGSCHNNHETFSLMKTVNPKSYAALTGKDEQKLLEFPVEKNVAITWNEAGEKTGSFGSGQNQLYLSYFSEEKQYPILAHFTNEIKGWAFYNFFPESMRGTSPVEKEMRLQFFGANLPVVLHMLQSEYPRIFKEIENILNTAINEFEELTTGLTQHKPGQTYIRIREKYLKSPVPAWAMSDGTLRFLGYLTAMFQPDLPSLLCFEEPEDYIHPRLLEMIVDLLKTASKKAQILVTTHSPYLVDFLQPEDLFIVEKKKGQTAINKAENKKGIKDALKKLGLGEMWYAGSLGGVP